MLVSMLAWVPTTQNEPKIIKIVSFEGSGDSSGRHHTIPLVPLKGSIYMYSAFSNLFKADKPSLSIFKREGSVRGGKGGTGRGGRRSGAEERRGKRRREGRAGRGEGVEEVRRVEERG